MAIERVASLEISTKSDGGASIKALVAQLEKLAAQGGESAPELAALAAEITKLEQARSAAQALGDLERTTNELTAGVSAAQAKIATLAPALLSANTATSEFASSQERAVRELDKAKQAVDENGYALKLLKAEMRDANGGTAEMVVREKELREAKKQLTAAVKEKQDALTRANAALTDAATAERALVTEIAQGERAIAGFNRALTQQDQALDAARTSADALGVNTARLAGEEQRLAGALQQATRGANEYVAGLDRAAAASAALEQSRVDEQMRLAAVAAQKASEYTNWWADALRDADVAAKALEQSRVDEQMRLAAVAAQKAAEYTRWWSDALREADAAAEASAQSAREAASAAAQAGQKIQDAFAVVGVRSAKQLEDEMYRIVRALEVVRRETGGVGTVWKQAEANAVASINKLEAEIRGLGTQTNEAGKKVGILTGMFKQLAIAYGGIELARKFIEANVQLENNRRALKAVTGSAEGAAKELEWLRGIADNLGVGLNGLTQQYISLIASTNGTALAGEQTRKIFESVANAMGQLGRSEVQVERAFMAIAQMASKGVVSMEELRQQLGEALPGSLQRAAEGLGVTTAELNEMVTSGQMLSEHFLPALAKGLDDTFINGTKRIDGFQQSWARLKQAMSDTSTFVGDSGVMKGLATMAEWATFGIRRLTAEVELLGTQLGITAGFIASFDFKAPIESANRWSAAMDEAKTRIVGSLTQANNAARLHSLEAQGMGDSAEAAGLKLQLAAVAATTNATAQEKVRAAAEAAATAQGKTGDAVKAAGEAAVVASGHWTAISNAYNQANTYIEAQTAVSEKLAGIKKLEGDTIVRLAQLTGDENRVREASVTTSRANVDALNQVNAARQNEILVIQGNIAALEAEGAAKNGLSQAEQAIVDKLKEKLALKQVEAEKSLQSLEAAKLEAMQARVTAEAYKNNADRMGEFKAAAQAAEAQVASLTVALAANRAGIEAAKSGYEQANAALKLQKDALDNLKATLVDIEIQQKAGKATEEQVAAIRRQVATTTENYAEAVKVAGVAERDWKAQQAASLPLEGQLSQARRDGAAAMALYRDALKDAADQTERKIGLLQQENNIATAKLQVDLEAARTAEALAVANGNETAAIQAKIEQKRIEKEIALANIQVKRQEIDLTIALARQELAESEASGTLTEQKRFEIESRIRAAEARRIEMGIAEQNIQQIDIEIQKLYELLNVKKGVNAETREANSMAGKGMGDPYEQSREAVAIDFESEMYRRGATVEEVQIAMQTVQGEFKRFMLEKGGNNDARNINANITKAVDKALLDAATKTKGPAIVNGDTSSPMFNTRSQAAANNVLFPTEPAPQQAAQPTAQPVNININGVRSTLNVASASDAATLQNVLRQLTEGASRA